MQGVWGEGPGGERIRGSHNYALSSTWSSACVGVLTKYGQHVLSPRNRCTYAVDGLQRGQRHLQQHLALRTERHVLLLTWKAVQAHSLAVGLREACVR